MRTVIFDLDGTLADTGTDLIAAANACFVRAGHGEVLDPVGDRVVAFKGGREMLRVGFTRLGAADVAAEVERDYPYLLAVYGDNIDTHTTLYPGVGAAIAALRDEGYAAAICTNKPEALAEMLMTRLGARDWFAALVGADTLPVRKPDPAPLLEAVRRAGGDPARAVLIGDSATDRETARAAGIPSVLVGFGPEGDGVAALAPEAVLAHYDDLGAVVRGLIG